MISLLVSNDQASFGCFRTRARTTGKQDTAGGFLSSLTLLPGVEWSVVWQILDADAISDQLVLRLEPFVLVSLELGEAPFV